MAGSLSRCCRGTAGGREYAVTDLPTCGVHSRPCLQANLCNLGKSIDRYGVSQVSWVTLESRLGQMV